MKLDRIVIDFSGERPNAHAIYVSTAVGSRMQGRDLLAADLGGIVGGTAVKDLVERAGDAVVREAREATKAAHGKM